jgi:2-polyprenyl-3-methyl-5-hydroxy-6-metoxy-1,4-benzoquinol methylase
VITDYSKALGDLTKEEASRIQNEEQLYIRQKEANKRLSKAPPRKICILCGSPIKGREFLHRGVSFITCHQCNHIQTKALPPAGFPDELEGKEQFSKIYPKLEKVQFEDRKNRIYRPKLNWIFSDLERSGYKKIELLNKKWLELGSGSGAFLASLEDMGVNNYVGFEKEETLLERAKAFLDPEKVSISRVSLGEIIRGNQADVICSFFVFEHDENISELINALKDCPKGTLLCFSVPKFGLSCLLENMASERYARSLDAAVHVQTFTDQSINFLLQAAGFEKIATWQFGQDALELRRLLFPIDEKGQHLESIGQKLGDCLDEIQATIDKVGLCDQIHLIARRKHSLMTQS